MNSDRYIIVKATEGIEVHTHERRVIVVVGGCRVNGTVTSLDDLTPPATATTDTPADTDTLPIHKGVAGWFKFTWAKLKELLTVLFVTVTDLFLTNRNQGFYLPDDVTVTDNGDRTVTVAGDLRATYLGKLISETVAAFDTSWTSPAHPEPDLTYYLTFNGTDIDWRTTIDFSTPWIAIKPKGCPFILRECHGRGMDEDTWRYIHFTIGTTLFSGGVITNIVEDSFVLDERRPVIGETVVLDEDLKGVLPELATKSYTRMYLSAVSANNFEEAQADIIEVGADNRPYYYDNSTGTYVKTLVPKVTTGAAAARARYLSVYLFGVPVAAGSSQPYRFILVQPQGFSTTLGGEIARSPANIDLGDMGVQSPEYVVFKQFIIRYDPTEGTGDWNHAQVVDIRGSQFAPLSVVNTGVQPSMQSPIEPSFEPVAVGDRLQQVGEKLAGLQENVVHEVEFTSDVTSVEITGLDLSDCEIVINGVCSDSQNNVACRINGNVNTEYWNSITNTFIDHFLVYAAGIIDGNFAGRLVLRKSGGRIIMEHIIGNSNHNTGAIRTISHTGFVPITGNITSLLFYSLLWKAGTTLKIYKL